CSSAARQHGQARRTEDQKRKAERIALSLARPLAQALQHQPFAGKHLAAAGEVLAQPLLLLRVHLLRSPAYFLLQRAQPRELGHRALDLLDAVAPRLALGCAEEEILHWIEPRLLDARSRDEQQSGESSQGARENGKRRPGRALHSEPERDYGDPGAEGADDRRAGRQVPGP